MPGKHKRPRMQFQHLVQNCSWSLQDMQKMLPGSTAFLQEFDILIFNKEKIHTAREDPELLQHADMAGEIRSTPVPFLLKPGVVCSTSFTGLLNALPPPSCDAEVDAMLPDADLSSESPKSWECRVSVLL